MWIKALLCTANIWTEVLLHIHCWTMVLLQTQIVRTKVLLGAQVVNIEQKVLLHGIKNVWMKTLASHQKCWTNERFPSHLKYLTKVLLLIHNIWTKPSHPKCFEQKFFALHPKCWTNFLLHIQIVLLRTQNGEHKTYFASKMFKQKFCFAPKYCWTRVFLHIQHVWTRVLLHIHNIWTKI